MFYDLQKRIVSVATKSSSVSWITPGSHNKETAHYPAQPRRVQRRSVKKHKDRWRKNITRWCSYHPRAWSDKGKRRSYQDPEREPYGDGYSAIWRGTVPIHVQTRTTWSAGSWENKDPDGTVLPSSGVLPGSLAGRTEGKQQGTSALVQPGPEGKAGWRGKGEGILTGKSLFQDS